MAFWQKRYPWTSLYDIDLKWIIDKLQDLNASFQAKLTAGANIQISDEDVISATDTTYTAGEYITISDDNVISANVSGLKFPQTSEGSVAVITYGQDAVPVTELIYTLDYNSNGYSTITGYKTNVNLLPNLKCQDGNNRVRIFENSLGTGNFLKAGTYTISATFSDNTEATTEIYWRTYDTATSTDGSVKHTPTITLANDTNVKIWLYKVPISTTDITSFQVNVGSSALAYDEHDEELNTFDLSGIGPVYGGTLNVTTGVVTATYAADGTTLEPPVTYNISPTEVNTFYGYNVLFNTAGNTSCTYYADPIMYLESKQDKLTAGTNITISADNVISAGSGTTYTAGTAIDIAGNVISGAYQAGSNVTITGDTIEATDTTYTAGTNVQISDQNVISATDTTYTAGTGISIAGTTINCTVSAGGGKTLLWTNPSPAAAFSAQTVSLDLSDYDAVMIEVRTNTEYDYYPTYEIIKGKESFMNPSLVTAGGVIYVYARLATVAADGITFGTGYYHATNATPTSTNAQMVVPIRIYGLTY